MTVVPRCSSGTALALRAGLLASAVGAGCGPPSAPGSASAESRDARSGAAAVPSTSSGSERPPRSAPEGDPRGDAPTHREVFGEPPHARDADEIAARRVAFERALAERDEGIRTGDRRRWRAAHEVLKRQWRRIDALDPVLGLALEERVGRTPPGPRRPAHLPDGFVVGKDGLRNRRWRRGLHWGNQALRALMAAVRSGDREGVWAGYDRAIAAMRVLRRGDGELFRRNAEALRLRAGRLLLHGFGLRVTAPQLEPVPVVRVNGVPWRPGEAFHAGSGVVLTVVDVAPPEVRLRLEGRSLLYHADE